MRTCGGRTQLCQSWQRCRASGWPSSCAEGLEAVEADGPGRRHAPPWQALSAGRYHCGPCGDVWAVGRFARHLPGWRHDIAPFRALMTGARARCGARYGSGCGQDSVRAVTRAKVLDTAFSVTGVVESGRGARARAARKTCTRYTETRTSSDAMASSQVVSGVILPGLPGIGGCTARGSLIAAQATAAAAATGTTASTISAPPP